ncbi:MAG: glycosyltransferase family 4 protein [Deltaproteobacteria bacterium]|nr:glycosyltransferase family 4 protein [Deltaproteobacteria bacterium]
MIEDFLDSIGISFDRFCKEMTGGWMFGYIDALQHAGFKTILFCVSARVTLPSRRTHMPTGSTICVLPASNSYRAIHRRMLNPYGWSVRDAFGDARGARYVMLAILKNVAPYLATPLRKLARELRNENCKAILCQEYEYARFDMCVLLGHLMRLPVFATFQGGDYKYSQLEHLLRPFTMRFCSGLIIASNVEIQRVRSRYGVSLRKIARIFNPLDLRVWHGGNRSLARQALNIPSEAQVVVWHGRIDLHRKGLDILIDAWERVHRNRSGRDLRLLLVGTGSDVELLRQRLSVMQLRGVLWVNEYILDRTAIRNYLSAADIYVLPSRHEGFPVAPLEAMACGLPVVATDAPGVSDILEGGENSGGIVVPRENSEAMALAIGRILDNEPLRRDLGRQARLRVESQFSLEAVGKQLRSFIGRAEACRCPSV